MEHQRAGLTLTDIGSMTPLLGSMGVGCLRRKRWVGVGVHVADVIDGHWRRKAAMDHQWAGLAAMGGGRFTVALASAREDQRRQLWRHGHGDVGANSQCHQYPADNHFAGRGKPQTRACQPKRRVHRCRQPTSGRRGSLLARSAFLQAGPAWRSGRLASGLLLLDEDPAHGAPLLLDWA